MQILHNCHVLMIDLANTITTLKKLNNNYNYDMVAREVVSEIVRVKISTDQVVGD